MLKLVVLTGAGMSAESGVSTFRDSGGLWEGHDVMQVASPQGFAANPSLVLEFYNQRRRQLFEVTPNSAHLALAQLEAHYNITVITQNVDDLHERAGSSDVVHLHGELLKARSTQNEHLVFDWKQDIVLGDTAEDGAQMRPHIVWFGEAVPMLEPAIRITEEADILLIIGTSMQVYPAASLVHYAQPATPIYFIDPKPTVSERDFDNLTIIPEKATNGVAILINQYLNG